MLGRKTLSFFERPSAVFKHAYLLSLIYACILRAGIMGHTKSEDVYEQVMRWRGWLCASYCVYNYIFTVVRRVWDPLRSLELLLLIILRFDREASLRLHKSRPSQVKSSSGAAFLYWEKKRRRHR
eukprot:Plantae.Rhodophyta-Purpureofilum_apyrenoidigerum.ctg10579.p2 GENE.Plantae.Rhodophyta-Purpureofilum_apyrenoidigerum.ctg10579~~Plantae.Rhodophyta-Purpureofilum_apyrenoidigerum.ctg10579.p2  ORF type:complete len:125 (+),score=18.15 Plantae.Rhodophyta-Purpureofilum_apyrenoidigerum.ctg10579:1618-1992(+)